MKRVRHPIVAVAVIHLVAAIVSCIYVTPVKADLDPLLLAKNGRTNYSIVSAFDQDEATRFAVEELSRFLNQITGADFPLRWDDSPPGTHEIVIGATNRMVLDDLPEDLRSPAWEGFAIVREGSRLIILGNIPRTTLYGVYDFLDVELGVRFLTPEVTHVPRKTTLSVDVASRRFDPRFEYRCINVGFDELWTVRNRMNALDSRIPLEQMLGGVRWTGRFVHTMWELVSVDDYFESYPEYFPLIEGKRRHEWSGFSGAYAPNHCMSNPDLPAVAAKKLREWIERSPQDRNSKYLVSLTINDSPYFCLCDPCKAINAEEGVTQGGTKMRFVNAVAELLAEEYPNVAVETMLYHTQMPRKTSPLSNVLVRAVHDHDWRFALDDPTHENNRRQVAFWRDLKGLIGDGGVYNWTKHVSFHDWLLPVPNLRHTARSLGVMNEHGVIGMFCQNQNTRDGQFQNIRYYVLARGMWRPEIDSRETIREFCRLYYGPAGEDVLKYINFIHDEYGDEDLAKRDMGLHAAYYDERFIRTADAILAEAEAKADTPQLRQRVAVERLPIWKIMLDRACRRIGRIRTLPVEWAFKFDAHDQGLEEGWARTTDFGAWGTMRTDKHWTEQGERRRGVAWYGIKFEIPGTGGAPLAFHFGAIDGLADIFIDGIRFAEQKLAGRAMWRQSFYRTIPPDIAPGPHTLIIRVQKRRFNAGIWMPISIIDMSTPISHEIRNAGERFLQVARVSKLNEIGEGAGPIEKNYYPKIEYFLTHGRRPER